ncbi:CatB-related O-acetyltransferase [Cellulophaga sp. L1A9]|uniref:CatB-related O-acetyltransferase n=1 Tax=Cellulophaga sp. L1A9 TaxID=2686362 RepID=UPI001E4C3F21|nr:CatB-related O-acetyltransferase [Cellulophaga sp. L1A9]
MKKLSIRNIYRTLKMFWYRKKFGLKNVDTTFYMGGKGVISQDLVAMPYVFIGANCIIPPKVTIGKYTMFAANVSILGGDHIFDNPERPIIFSGRPSMPKTTIGEDVWVGANACIMAGLVIGDGAIVAAGSIVTKNIEPYSIYGGNPAKLIRMRFNEEEIALHQKMLLNTNIDVNFTENKKH